MDIFNLSISTKVFPDDLKVLKVVPVYISGERENFKQSQTNSCSTNHCTSLWKTFVWATVQLIWWTINYSLYSTALALGKSTDYWLMNIDNGKLNSVVFLDIRKAFDTVNHDILLQKLECYGIQGNELIFFQSYLENRIQTCNVNGHMPSFKMIFYGVPQGSTGCPKKKTFNCLIWCKLKTTVFTRSVFIFFKSSYFNLTFGIKQSKISKFAEQWLPKVKILEPVDDRRPDFFEKFINLRQPYCFNKIHWSLKNSWICKTDDCFT